MERKNTDKTGQIVSLAQRKVLLLRRYLSITEELRDCLEKETAEPVGFLVAGRQKCIEEVQAADNLLEMDLKDLRGATGLIESHRKQMKDLLSRIEILDQEVIHRMKEESETLKSELLKMRTVRKATEKYRGQSIQGPRFLDMSR